MKVEMVEELEEGEPEGILTEERERYDPPAARSSGKKAVASSDKKKPGVETFGAVKTGSDDEPDLCGGVAEPDHEEEQPAAFGRREEEEEEDE